MVGAEHTPRLCGGERGVSKRQVTENVWAFIGRAAELCGKLEAERFAQDMQADCLERGTQSPIEDMFWVACSLMARSLFIDINPEPDAGKDGEIVFPDGIYIRPQAMVGKYRADFCVHSLGFGPAEVFTPVIVELDGHDFHDKDKRQRSYEKKRDRDLIRAGYKVLHFTGSDVVKDPFACAFEVFQMVGAFTCRGIEDYDPRDPLFQGDA
jgi:very-short-patch-repair endonuclease